MLQLVGDGLYIWNAFKKNCNYVSSSQRVLKQSMEVWEMTIITLLFYRPRKVVAARIHQIATH